MALLEKIKVFLLYEIAQRYIFFKQVMAKFEKTTSSLQCSQPPRPFTHEIDKTRLHNNENDVLNIFRFIFVDDSVVVLAATTLRDARRRTVQRRAAAWRQTLVRITVIQLSCLTSYIRQHNFRGTYQGARQSSGHRRLCRNEIQCLGTQGM